MPLHIEIPEDEHPEVTEFAKKVVETGKRYQDNGAWCETWKQCVVQMGLDPVLGLSSPPLKVSVQALLPVEVELTVDPRDYVGLDPDEQVAKMQEFLKNRILAYRTNPQLLALYQDRNRSNYLEGALFRKVEEPMVMDLYVTNGYVPGIRNGLSFEPDFEEQANRVAVAYLNDGHRRHLLLNVRQELVGNGHEYSSACEKYRTNWASAPGRNRSQAGQWCGPCLNKARAAGWHLQGVFHGTPIVLADEAPATNGKAKAVAPPEFAKIGEIVRNALGITDTTSV